MTNLPTKQNFSPEVWYRFEDFREADYDPWAEFEQPSTSHAALRLREYRVDHHTPKGVWLSEGSGLFKGEARFVLKEATRRFACPTIEEAKQSWRARKAKQIRIMQRRIANVEEALALMDRRWET